MRVREALKPIKPVEVRSHVRGGLPPLHGVVFHDAEKSRVWIAWLGLNVIIRWGLWLYWYVQNPGQYGPLAKRKTLKRVHALEKKCGALSHAFCIQEPVLRLARRLASAKVEAWPDLMGKLRDEVVEAERKTLALYSDEKDLRR